MQNQSKVRAEIYAMMRVHILEHYNVVFVEKIRREKKQRKERNEEREEKVMSLPWFCLIVHASTCVWELFRVFFMEKSDVSKKQQAKLSEPKFFKKEAMQEAHFSGFINFQDPRAKVGLVTLKFLGINF